MPELTNDIEKVKLSLTCDYCHDSKKIMMDIKQCLETVGLKGMLCSKCKKMGSYIATANLDGKKITWKVINYITIDGKKIIINSKTNENNKIKKKIYPNLSNSELEQKKPYVEINHHLNKGIAKEEIVDEEGNPIEIKWTKEFEKKNNVN